ncbi:hypothetical protein NFJ02_05g121140 [Pycnococcus provasolii]
MAEFADADEALTNSEELFDALLMANDTADTGTPAKAAKLDVDTVKMVWDALTEQHDDASERPSSEVSRAQFETLFQDGILSIEKLNHATEAVRAFNNIDRSNDGTIDKPEFKALFVKLGHNVPEEDLEEMWTGFDADGGGDVNFAEFLSAMHQLEAGKGKFKKAATLKITIDEIATMPTFLAESDISEIDSENRIKTLSVMERMAYEMLKALYEYRERQKLRKDSKKEQQLGQVEKGADHAVKAHKMRLKSIMEMEDSQNSETSVKEDEVKVEMDEEVEAPKPKGIFQSQKSMKGTKDVALSEHEDSFVPSDDERTTVMKLRFWAIFGCTAAGAVGAGICAVAEYLAIHFYGEPEYKNEETETNDFWYYHLILVLPLLVSSALEVCYMYYTLLRTALKMADAVGLKLYPADAQRTFVASGLTRGALELPHPVNPVLGIDPYYDTNKIVKAMLTLAYMGKTGVTNFILRIFFKRVVFRSVLRGAAPFVAIPVCAFMNFVIGFRTSKDIMASVQGVKCAPGIFEDLLGRFKYENPTKASLSTNLRNSLFRVAALVLVSKQTVHPNLEILLKYIRGRLSNPKCPLSEEPEDGLRWEDMDACTSRMQKLSDEEKKLCMKVMALTVTLDGYALPRTWKLYQTVCKDSGLGHSSITGLRSAEKAFANFELTAKNFVQVPVLVGKEGGMTAADRLEIVINNIVGIFAMF